MGFWISESVRTPDILFLSETKLDERRMQKFWWIHWMTNMAVHKCKGRGGGLALFWKRGLEAELHNMSSFHIDVEVKEADGFKWRFTGVYGEAHAYQKGLTWRLMRNLHNQMSMPWICAGDFNEILDSHEKQGGQDRAQICVERFRDALEFYEKDLGFEGDGFKWWNHNHSDERYIRERPDRAMANQA